MRAKYFACGAALVISACGGADGSTEKPCVAASGIMCTFAGTGTPGSGAEGLRAVETELYLPQDVSINPDGVLFIIDWNNHRVRSVKPDGTTETVIGSGEVGDAPDGQARNVAFNHPTHVGFDTSGGFILGAWHNSKIMRMDPATKMITRICGTGAREFGGDGGPALEAKINLPVATAYGPDGTLYIAEQGSQRVRAIGLDGMIRTAVGTGERGFAGDEGPAVDALLQDPAGQAASPSGKIAIDADGNLYIADSGNQRIRKVTTDGIIHTVAGTGVRGTTGDGGPAIQATISRPTDIAFGPDGGIYFADTDNNCVRKIDPAGVMHTVAGICGSYGDGADGSLATETLLDQPFGIEVDRENRLYVADTYNHRIRIVYP